MAEDIPSQYEVSSAEYGAEGHIVLIPEKLTGPLMIQHSPASSPQRTEFKQLYSENDEKEEPDCISSVEESSESGFDGDAEKSESGNEDSEEAV